MDQVSQGFKARRCCGRRLHPGAFQHHPALPGCQGRTSQLGRQRGRCSPSPALGSAVGACQDTLLICVMCRDHHGQPSELQQGGTPGTGRNGYGPAAQTGKGGFQELDHGTEQRPARPSTQLCGKRGANALVETEGPQDTCHSASFLLS